ncbi:MAG: hypothetical protein V7607_3027 [Solirubrobacteraceae bacterium]
MPGLPFLPRVWRESRSHRSVKSIASRSSIGRSRRGSADRSAATSPGRRRADGAAAGLRRRGAPDRTAPDDRRYRNKARSAARRHTTRSAGLDEQRWSRSLRTRRSSAPREARRSRPVRARNIQRTDRQLTNVSCQSDLSASRKLTRSRAGEHRRLPRCRAQAANGGRVRGCMDTGSAGAKAVAAPVRRNGARHDARGGGRCSSRSAT